MTPASASKQKTFQMHFSFSKHTQIHWPRNIQTSEILQLLDFTWTLIIFVSIWLWGNTGLLSARRLRKKSSECTDHTRDHHDSLGFAPVEYTEPVQIQYQYNEHILSFCSRFLEENIPPWCQNFQWQIIIFLSKLFQCYVLLKWRWIFWPCVFLSSGIGMYCAFLWKIKESFIMKHLLPHKRCKLWASNRALICSVWNASPGLDPLLCPS